MTIRAIRPRIGAGHLKDFFGDTDFPSALKEYIKNSRDWGANAIAIDSTDRAKLKYVDNGVGMGADNRDSFLSVRLSNCNDSQHGQYDTGSKWFPYSFCTDVQVRTVSEENPELVVRFGYAIDKYEEMARREAELMPETATKTGTTWPFPFKTGSWFEFAYSQPKSKHILRGDQLALTLAAMLPLKFRDIIRVDGKQLPERKLIGRVYELPGDLVPPELKAEGLHVELYRAETKCNEDGLRLTGVEIGDVEFVEFFKAVPELRDRIPTFFLTGQVLGTIRCAFLKKCVRQDRKSLRLELRSDERTFRLAKLLQRIGPDVREALQIQDDAGTLSSDTNIIEEVMQDLNEAFAPGEHKTVKSVEPIEVEESGGGPDDANKPPLTLTVERREYEPGETVRARVKLRKDLLDAGYKLADVDFLTERAGGPVASTSEGECCITARDLGPAYVRADIRKQLVTAIVKYEVVERRRFRITPTFRPVVQGTELRITAVNADKLKGALEWRSLGVGEVRGHGLSATFKGTALGRGEIIATDSDDPSTRSACEVEVIAGQREKRLVKIKDHWFDATFENVGSTGEFARPAVMWSGDDVHNLYWNVGAPGYEEARRTGTLPLFLKMAAAIEYARLRLTELDLSSEDSQPSVEAIESFAFSVLAELLQKTPVKKRQ